MGDSYYLGKGLSSLFWPKAKIDIADVEPKQSWCISKWTWAGGWIGAVWGDSWDQLLDEIASVRKVVASFRFPGPDVSFSELRGKVILHLGPVGTVFDYAAACWTFPQSWHFFFSFLLVATRAGEAEQSRPSLKWRNPGREQLSDVSRYHRPWVRTQKKRQSACAMRTLFCVFSKGTQEMILFFFIKNIIFSLTLWEFHTTHPTPFIFQSFHICPPPLFPPHPPKENIK